MNSPKNPPANTPNNPPANPPAAGGKKGRKPGQPAKEWDYTGLTADFLSDAHGVSAELASLAAPMRARDERQVAMDQVVAKLHIEYQEAGKPDRWSQMPKRSYHVDPKVADTVRMLARRAAGFYGLSIKFGGSVRDTQGREIVVFAVRDQRVRAAKGKDTWTLAELREFVTEFFAEDAEGAAEFLSDLTGEGEGEDADENSESESSTGETPSE